MAQALAGGFQRSAPRTTSTTAPRRSSRRSTRSTGSGIAHTGSGAERSPRHTRRLRRGEGLRVGFLQRTSVYWPTNHEAGEHSARRRGAARPHRVSLPAAQDAPRHPADEPPGVPPEVVTWADPEYLERLRADIEALREQADIVVASHHWGLRKDVLQYMTEIAHAAIDAGADIVVGHGPHYSLPVEVYKGKPIFYGLGSFSFHTGHGGRKHGDWVGMLARVTLEERGVERASFQFVRHNERERDRTLRDAGRRRDAGQDQQAQRPLRDAIEVEGDEGVLRPA